MNQDNIQELQLNKAANELWDMADDLDKKGVCKYCLGDGFTESIGRDGIEQEKCVCQLDKESYDKD